MSASFLGNWETQVRKGLVELCILNILSRQELYGYDIVRALIESGGIVTSEGTIYPLLSRLRREGLIEARLIESDKGPARKYYQLTTRGRATLKKMNTLWGDVATSVSESQRGIAND